MVSRPRPAAFGLRDLLNLAAGIGQPLIDVIFMRRVNKRFAMAADKREYFDAFFHDEFSPLAPGPLEAPKSSLAILRLAREKTEFNASPQLLRLPAETDPRVAVGH